MLVERFLDTLAAAAVQPQSCELTLTQQADIKQLICHANYDVPPSPCLVAEMSAVLMPFLETFRLFTQGEYEQDTQACSFHWKLCWKMPRHTHL
jgi:hypothetical protein